MDKPIAMPKFRPAPVTEKHIQTAFSIVQRRENIRRGQYRSLPDEDEPTRVAYRASFGIHPHNAGCNRYMTVVPYDWSRVILPPPSSSQSDGTSNSSPYSGITGNSYINASWVRELSGGKWTVATQAPLERTAHAFLSMLLLLVSPPQSEPTSTTRDSSVTPPPMANQLRTIVQLTPYMEGKAKKAFQYFPQEIGQELIWQPEMRASHPSTDEGSNTGVEILHHPSISVTLLDAIPSKHEEPIWVQSILKVSFVGSPEPGHIVRHLHYLVSVTFPPRNSWVYEYYFNIIDPFRLGRIMAYLQTFNRFYNSCNT